MKKTLGILFLFLLFLPYFFRPFALNLNPDMGLQMMDVFRMADARWSFSFDPSAAYANPVVQMLVDFHGIFRQLIYFPVFYILDLLGMGIREATVYGTLLVVGILITYLNYLFVRVLVGEKKAFWFTVLLSVIPFYVLQVKGGWWHVFVYPLLLAGLAAEYRFLQSVILEAPPKAGTIESSADKKKSKKWYALFCFAASVYLLADTGFVFGGLLYVLYALVFFTQKGGGLRSVFWNIWHIVRSPWTLLPLLVLVGSAAVTYIGKTRFGADFGIMARFLEKGGHVGFTGLGIIPHFISQGMGLTGFLLFPALLLTAIWVLYVVILELRRGTIESRRDAFVVTLVIYFFATFLLLLLAGGSGAAVYELYIPGLLLLVYAFSYLKKVWIQNVFMAGIAAVTMMQTVAYNFEIKPPAILARSYSFIRPNDACTALWCPWHFAEPKNLGVTTAAFALRDYLGVTPTPFISMQENFYDKPKEIFFYSNYGQGPSMSIGRRISYEVGDVATARVIVAFTPKVLELAPNAVDPVKNQAVWDFLAAHAEYKEVAFVTMDGAEIIQIFERDSTREERVFSVEEYDAKFNQKYGHLRDIGFIDLG
ncbi:MAG: hypothetical protein HY437_00100 [Candidatus Magasanikbacteria bacterium]|nr:hypothetical protein [Candidatus Magasanikbacteria bacterium]